MTDLVMVAFTLLDIISKIVYECEQRTENAQVMGELRSFLQSLRNFIQQTQEKALTLHNNSALWALGSLKEDLENAIFDASSILNKGFVRSLWDANKIFSRVEALHNRVTTSFQTKLSVAALDVAIESKQAQDAFQAAMLKVNKELQESCFTASISVKQEHHLALRKELRQALQPITLALESHSHKIEAAVSTIHSFKPQTSDTEKFFEDVLAALDGLSVKKQGEGEAASASDNAKQRSGGPVKWYGDPITWEIMCDPVKATDGHTYDRWTILGDLCHMATSPFWPGDSRPFHIALDDIDVRSRLFLKFPEQESQFRAKRAAYRDAALHEAQLGHFADSASMLGHVLQWAPQDLECSEKLQYVQRRMTAGSGKSIPASDGTHLLARGVDQSRQDAGIKLCNTRSNGDRLSLSPDGLSCRLGSFAAAVELDSVGAAIADMAVPVRDEQQRSSTIFYFEISIEELDGNNVVGLGFTRSQSFHDNLLPGCYPNSCGYHGDRGYIFAEGSRLVQQGGPTARKGDTMGAGIHHGHKEMFFVHNGALIAVIANTLSGTVMPVVALGSPGAYIKVAFNGSAFHPEPKPSRLVMSDLSSQRSIASLSSDGLITRYIGGPNRPVLSLQADYGACFRHPSQIYYFELTVINKHIAIGFVNPKFFEANKLPGTYPHSCAYHGDDGNLFFGCPRGSEFGPAFSTGDTIGAGIDHASGTIFFIKNGKKVGHTCRLSMSCDLYPVIGLHSPDEAVSLNFGQAPFSFDTSIIPNLDAEEQLTRLNVPSSSISKRVSLSRDGLTAHYIARQSAVARRQPAAALMADRAVYTFRRVYYFELTVLNRGAGCAVGIGFCNQGDFDCHMMPGWYIANSYGKLFTGGDGVGKEFGPTFSTGDDVGAGFDYSNNTIFFTKNGSLVGHTMEMNISSSALCAVIGLLGPNAKVHLNFGRHPFSFDTSQIGDLDNVCKNEMNQNQSL